MHQEALNVILTLVGWAVWFQKGSILATVGQYGFKKEVCSQQLGSMVSKRKYPHNSWAVCFQKGNVLVIFGQYGFKKEMS